MKPSTIADLRDIEVCSQVRVGVAGAVTPRGVLVNELHGIAVGSGGEPLQPSWVNAVRSRSHHGAKNSRTNARVTRGDTIDSAMWPPVFGV